jgi:cell division septation protein DedD
MEPALKQRLVGAAVLVALAVIFLPMLIQGPAPESGVSNVSLDAPPAPQGEFQTRDLPLVAPEGAPAEGALGMENTPPQPAPAVATAATVVTPMAATTVPDKPAATTEPLAADEPFEMFPAPTAGGNYAVHVGSFATAAAADKLIASLRDQQLPAFREGANVDGKTVQRVRIGPFATRSQAEDARLRASRVRDGAASRVVALDAEAAEAAKPVATTKPEAKPAAPKPDAAKPAVAKATEAPKPAAAKPATATAASGTGFAVQLAAFSKSADANALRDKLRAAGFSAFTEVVNTDKGALTRVRVGPVLNRAEADQLKAQVKSKVGLDGIVRPHP